MKFLSTAAALRCEAFRQSSRLSRSCMRRVLFVHRPLCTVDAPAVRKQRSRDEGLGRPGWRGEAEGPGGPGVWEGLNRPQITKLSVPLFPNTSDQLSTGNLIARLSRLPSLSSWKPSYKSSKVPCHAHKSPFIPGDAYRLSGPL